MPHAEAVVAFLILGVALVVVPRLLVAWSVRRSVRDVQARIAHPERFPPPPRREPESRVVVHLSEAGVRCERPGGPTEQVAWDDLQRVEIMTTGDGPFQPDVFWMLLGTVGGCAVPQGATGDAALLERLGQLPGFDHEAVIRAMGSTEDAHFLCWQRAA